ncbi:MAG: biotin--[acetyl-CoA-carboxylase] ligase [Nitriliruptoraceae bacterium]|nr:biotin--[acetyl-CoA-carboxylase] ligase [Nitriliruptoraceae bacterium]
MTDHRADQAPQRPGGTAGDPDADRAPWSDLAEDRHVRTVLRAAVPTARWTRVVHHAVVGSTQDVALQALRDGAAPGLVVVADAQQQGRGRRGRPWRDDVTGPAGPANLAVTATLSLPRVAPGLVPLVAGLAVGEAYRAAGADPSLKWPNDVLLGGRKAAGILVERHTVVVAGAPGAGDVLLVGCGLDLDWRGVERTGPAAAWTSLGEALGDAVDRGAVLAALLGALDDGLSSLQADPERLLARYRACCATIGRQVEVQLPDGSIRRGVAASVDAEGRLVVRDGSGAHPVSAGDVVHVHPG